MYDRRDRRLHQGLAEREHAHEREHAERRRARSGTSPAAPERRATSTAQTSAMTTITRVRRRPLMRDSTGTAAATITAVLTANAMPIVRVDTSATWRAYAGNPASNCP